MPDITGWPPQAYGIWLFGSVFAGGWFFKLLAEWRAWKKLPIEEQQAKREGFTAQVELLQRQLDAERDENRRTRSEIADLRERLARRDNDFDAYRATSQHETDQLRDEIRALEDMVAGFRRKLDEQSLKRFDDLTPAEAPEATRAAERVRHIQENGKEGGGK